MLVCTALAVLDVCLIQLGQNSARAEVLLEIIFDLPFGFPINNIISLCCSACIRRADLVYLPAASST